MSIRRFHEETWLRPTIYRGSPMSTVSNPRSFSYASVRTMTRTANWRNVEKNNKVGMQKVVGRYYGLGQDLISPSDPLPRNLMGEFD